MSISFPVEDALSPYLAQLVTSLSTRLSFKQNGPYAHKTRDEQLALASLISALKKACSSKFGAALRTTCASSWRHCEKIQCPPDLKQVISDCSNNLNIWFKHELLTGAYSGQLSEDGLVRLDATIVSMLPDMAEILIEYYQAELANHPEPSQPAAKEAERSDAVWAGLMGLGRDKVQAELTRIINLKVENVLAAMDLPARIARSFTEYAEDISPLDAFTAEHAQAELRAAAADYAQRMSGHPAPVHNTGIEFSWVVRSLDAGRVERAMDFFTGTKEFALSKLFSWVFPTLRLGPEGDAEQLRKKFEALQQAAGTAPQRVPLGQENMLRGEGNPSSSVVSPNGERLNVKFVHALVVRKGTGELVATHQLYVVTRPAEGVEG